MSTRLNAMQRKQVGECWVYVILFACACGGEVHMSALRLTIVNFFGLFLAIFGNFLKICNLILINVLESIF